MSKLKENINKDGLKKIQLQILLFFVWVILLGKINYAKKNTLWMLNLLQFLTVFDKHLYGRFMSLVAMKWCDFVLKYISLLWCCTTTGAIKTLLMKMCQKELKMRRKYVLYTWMTKLCYKTVVYGLSMKRKSLSFKNIQKLRLNYCLPVLYSVDSFYAPPMIDKGHSASIRLSVRSSVCPASG